MWRNMVKGHFHNWPDTVFVDFMRAERFDTIILENALLGFVHVTKANAHRSVGS
jgi:hypothetical protein